MKLIKYSTQTVYYAGKDDEYMIKIDQTERSSNLYMTVERYNPAEMEYIKLAYKHFDRSETSKAKAYARDIITVDRAES